MFGEALIPTDKHELYVITANIVQSSVRKTNSRSDSKLSQRPKTFVQK